MDNELTGVMEQADHALSRLMGRSRKAAIPDEDKPLSGFGARLRLLRMERGISLNELAIKAGLSKGSLFRLEESADGQPTAKTLIGLATALGISIDEMLDYRPKVVHRCPICRGNGWLVEDAI